MTYCPPNTRFTLMPPASDSGYREWRATKLDGYPRCASDLVVQVGELTDPDSSALAAIRSNCARANMAIYACGKSTVDHAAVLTFAAHVGLRRIDHHLCADDDGIAEITATHEDRRGGYVPYSRRSLSWHTDGYYNERSSRVRAVLLHCVQNAANGGQTSILDPEIAYIRLRDANTAYVTAFEHPECMTIPANVEGGKEIRPAVSGPVFSFDTAGNALHMRYSARKKNIRWRDDPTTTAAREFLSALLADEEGPVLKFDLRPGQGLISNNVLHNRTAFEDGPAQKRLLYRARFLDRINPS